YLYLNVPGFFNIFFQVNGIVAKSSPGLHFCRFKCFFKLTFFPNHPHSTAAAAGRGFNNDGIANMFCNFFEFFHVLYQSVGTGDNGDARFFHGVFCARFVAHCIDHFRPWANELDTMQAAYFRKLGIFRQEPVTGVYSIGSCNFSRGHDAGYIQVRLCTWRRTDTYRFVCETHMQAVAVSGAIYRNGFYIHLLAGTDNAEGNFTAVSYKNLIKHNFLMASNYSTRNKGWSYSTGDISSTRILTTVPSTSDSISLKSFMASITQTTCPLET